MKKMARELSVLGIIAGIIALLFSLYTLAPLLDSLVAGFIVSYMTYPVFSKVRRILKGESVSAFLTTVVLILPVILFVMYLAYIILIEFELLRNKITSPGFSFGAIISPSPEQALGGYSLDQIFPYVSSLGESSFIVIKLIIFLIAMYYGFIEIGRLRERIEGVKIAENNAVYVTLKSLDNILSGMLFGYVLTSLIVAIMAGVAYALLGIQNAFILGFATGIFSLLPVVGAWMVYVPLGLFEIYKGFVPEGIAVIVFGILFLSILQDVYVRVKLSKKISDVHPILIIIGFIAGPIQFGVFGLIYGPLAVGLLKGLFDGLMYHYFGEKTEGSQLVNLLQDRTGKIERLLGRKPEKE